MPITTVRKWHHCGYRRSRPRIPVRFNRLPIGTGHIRRRNGPATRLGPTTSSGHGPTTHPAPSRPRTPLPEASSTPPEPHRTCRETIRCRPAAPRPLNSRIPCEQPCCRRRLEDVTQVRTGRLKESWTTPTSTRLSRSPTPQHVWTPSADKPRERERADHRAPVPLAKVTRARCSVASRRIPTIRGLRPGQ